MNVSELRDFVEDARSRLRDVDQQVAAERCSAGEAYSLVTEEMHNAVEELRVAEESLRDSQSRLIETHQQLEEAVGRYRELFEFAPDGYLVTDLRGCIVEANRRAAALLGRRHDLMIGKPLSVFLLDRDLDALYSRLEAFESKRLDRVEGWELALRLPDSSTTRVESCVEAVREGAVPGLRWMLRDAEARHDAEDRLEAHSELFRSVLAQAPSAILVLDLEGHVERLNSFAEELLGGNAQEIRGADWLATFVPDGDHRRVQEAFRRATEGEDTGGTVSEIVTPDGRRSLVWSHTLLRDAHGEPSGILAIGQDVSDLEDARSALDASRALVSACFEAAADAMMALDEGGVVRAVNSAAERMFGRSSQEMIGSSLAPLIPALAGDHGDDQRDLHALAAGPEGGVAQIDGRYRDGSRLPLRLSVSRVHDGGSPGFVVVLVDLSARRELERHLAEAGSRERRELAQDLHDALGGQILGIAIHADLLRRALEATGMDQAGTAAELVAQAREAHGQIRQLARTILPVPDDDLGLVGALRELARRVELLGQVTCAFDCPRAVVVPQHTAASHLFFIAEEAVNNALRHSGAEHIQIGLKKDQGRVVVTVRDDGRGIDPESMGESRGMGLRTMRHRADLIGATLDVESTPRGGTEVRCALERSS